MLSPFSVLCVRLFCCSIYKSVAKQSRLTTLWFIAAFMDEKSQAIIGFSLPTPVNVNWLLVKNEIECCWGFDGWCIVREIIYCIFHRLSHYTVRYLRAFFRINFHVVLRSLCKLDLSRYYKLISWNSYNTHTTHIDIISKVVNNNKLTRWSWALCFMRQAQRGVSHCWEATWSRNCGTKEDLLCLKIMKILFHRHISRALLLLCRKRTSSYAAPLSWD